jgi:hypothetical protein
MLKPLQVVDPRQLETRMGELKLESTTFARKSEVRRQDLRTQLQFAVKPVETMLGKAESYWAVGTSLPAMGKVQGKLRGLVTPMAKSFLRIAQLVTRDQREFNRSMLNAVRSLSQAVANLGLQASDEMAFQIRSSSNTTTEELEVLRKRVELLEQKLRDQKLQSKV